MLDPAIQPGEISVEVTPAGGDSPSDDMFRLVIKRNGEMVEEFDRASFGRGKQNVVTMVNAASKTISVEDTGSGAVERLADGETALVAPASGRPAVAPAERRRLRRRRRRSDWFRRPGGGRRDHHVVRSGPDERLPAGLDRPRHCAGGAEAMIADRELMGDGSRSGTYLGFNASRSRSGGRKARNDSAYAALYWPRVKTMNSVTGSDLDTADPGIRRDRAAMTTPAASTRRRPTRSSVG